MKKTITLFALMFVAICSNGETPELSGFKADKAPSNSFNLIGLNVGTGYTGMYDTRFDKNLVGMAGFDIGFSFEQRSDKMNGNMWYNLNPGFQMMTAYSTNQTSDFTLRVKDTKGYEMDCHYSDFSPLKENHNVIGVYMMSQIGYINIENGLYLGGGAKVLAGCMVENVSAKYQTSATYAQYIDDFTDMDNHYYTLHNVKRNKISNFCVGGMLSFEIGYSIAARQQKAIVQNYKIGAYVEAGVMGVSLDGKGKATAPCNEYYFKTPTPQADATELVPMTFYEVNAIPHAVVSYNVGVRFTILFRYSGTRCRNC